MLAWLNRAKCGIEVSDDFAAIRFLTQLDGNGKWPHTMAELIDGWIAYWNDNLLHLASNRSQLDWATDCVGDLIEQDAKLALDFVLAVLATKPHDRLLPVLAAGPLEDVLANHGPKIIDRVEVEAARSPTFRELLGGVWKNKMPDDVWQRVVKAAPVR